MARKRTIAAGALNIRLHPHPDGIYLKFFEALHKRKYITPIRGETCAAITYLQRISDTELFGTFAKFSKIDAGSEWFNAENFLPLDEDDIPDIDPNLYPNYRPFFFFFNARKHTFVYEKYGSSGALSPSSTYKFFSNISKNLQFRSAFGNLEVDHIKDKAALKKLLDYNILKRLEIEIRRINPDYLSPEKEQEISERMRVERSRKETRTIHAAHGESLEPTDDTLAEAEMAIDNGKVISFGKNENGTNETRSSEHYPREERDKYDPDTRTAADAFIRLARKFFE